ncbi:MAG: ABC-F family ATP-binding cassette domain-containing protein [Clostridia bacterium]|nr:ABC-F family ATP-binding cassette domain-containing protein [Clostridia bacterium]
MIEIEVKGLSKMYGGNSIFDSVNFTVKTGEKIGLIGLNGCGKTTLMRILAEEESADAGDIFKKKGLKCSYLAQIPTYPEGVSVLEVLMEAFGEVGSLKRHMSVLEKRLADASEDMEKLLLEYGHVQERFTVLEGYGVDEKLKRITIGMSFSDDFLSRHFMSLSGGEKTKVMLGRMLLEEPDVMLLDEPTNHLDIKTLEWLEGYIVDSASAMIMISHDRYFLDHTVGKIVELARGATVEFYGNYSGYITHKETLKVLHEAQYKQQEKKIGAMEDAIKRFRDWGTRSDNEAMFKKAKAMEKRIERMDKVERPKTARNIHLNFEMSERSGKDVIQVKEATIGYGTPLFHIDAFILKFSERLVLLGDNGTGKTTLFKVIQKDLPPLDGQLVVGDSVKIGALDQEIYFDAGEKNILTYFREATLLNEGESRQKLARYLFTGESVFKKVESLSGGEKVRLKLALLMEEDINMLLMDEPTNHIDIASRETLESALVQFPGTILFVSHDRFFIEKVATRVAEVREGRLWDYAGDYCYYKEERKKQGQSLQGSVDPVDPVDKMLLGESQSSVLASKGKTRSEEQQRQREVKKLERQMASLEESIQILETEMTTLHVEIEANTTDYVLLGDLNATLTEKQKVHDRLSAQWMALSETIENLNSEVNPT